MASAAALAAPLESSVVAAMGIADFSAGATSLGDAGVRVEAVATEPADPACETVEAL